MSTWFVALYSDKQLLPFLCFLFVLSGPFACFRLSLLEKEPKISDSTRTFTVIVKVPTDLKRIKWCTTRKMNSHLKFSHRFPTIHRCHRTPSSILERQVVLIP